MLQPGQSFAVFLGDSIPAGYEGAAITVATLLDNDWDPNGDALELVLVGNLSERWHFDSELHAWVFTAPPEFSGVDDSFEYFVTDRVPVNRLYSGSYNEDETYPYSASWRVCMLLQVGGGGGGGGGDGQQPAQLPVTVKNVFRPQTMFYKVQSERDEPEGPGVIIETVELFSFWWAVALYLEPDGVRQLANLGGNKAFVVTYREWQAEIGGKQFKDNSWHLETVNFHQGQLVPNPSYAGPPGGARTMEDVDETKITALNYISVVNSEGFIGRTKGENSMIVTVEWWVYAGSPGEGILRQFGSDIVRKYRELAQVYMIGRDHYVHNWWTNQRPQINVQPVASGRLSGAIVWNWDKDFDHWFGSPNTDLIRGPQRDGRGPWLPNEEDRISVKWWEYDKAAKKWVNVYR